MNIKSFLVVVTFSFVLVTITGAAETKITFINKTGKYYFPNVVCVVSEKLEKVRGWNLTFIAIANKLDLTISLSADLNAAKCQLYDTNPPSYKMSFPIPQFDGDPVYPTHPVTIYKNRNNRVTIYKDGSASVSVKKI